MVDSMSDDRMRGHSQAQYWDAECKDCLAEQRERVQPSQLPLGKRADGREKPKPAGSLVFEYSGSWANRSFELGHTRSDRCERHRKRHRDMIRALSVPYVALDVIGEVRDQNNPTGPLGGLGPLPKPHRRMEVKVDLQTFGFGMSDADILKILDGMKGDKRVAVIEAGTGTGKSTFMPFRLMSPPPGAAFRPTDTGQIVVTEPRREAATGVARFVGEALVFGHNSQTCNSHIGPGFPVGYQVSGDRKWDSACELVYVTDGTMINWVRDGSLARIGLVIVDEAHERSVSIDIILAQLREKLSEYKHLRVIVTSATIDPHFFIDYFGGPDRVFHHEVPAKKSFGYGVPFFRGLEINPAVILNGIVLEGNGLKLDFSGWSGLGPRHEGYPADDLARETAKYAVLRVGREIPMERWSDQMPRAVAEQVIAIAKGTEFGDILGFLPTTEKIKNAIGFINHELEASGLNFDVYPLLSKTKKEIINAAVAARKRGDKRKIVISSNLAETSITVSGVRYVVDSGLICQSQWNAEVASGGLPTLPHSQSGLRQRWGRVGRDAPGWVFPLYTAEQFFSLPRDTPPEPTRTNLEAFCTRLISTGLDPSTAVLPGNFTSERYQPDEFGREAAETFTKELARASRVLRSGGLVDADGDLTDLGRETERFSGTASEALAIALGDRLACLHEVALAIVVVSRGKISGKESSILAIRRAWAPEWRLRADACHRALAKGCDDDLDLALRVAALYRAAEDGRKWCRTWWINQAALDEALAEIASIIETLSAAMKHEVSRPFQPSLLPRARAAMTHAFGEHVYTRSDDSVVYAVSDGVRARLLARSLVEPQGRFMAFVRVEKRKTEEEVERRISHFIRHDERMSLAAWDSAPSDFDVLLRLADGRRTQTAEDVGECDWLGYARALLPIGTVVRFERALSMSDGSIWLAPEGWQILRTPFLLQEIGFNESSADDGGFESEFDPYGPGKVFQENEDEIIQLIDPRKVEQNDQAYGEIERVFRPAGWELPFQAKLLHARMLFDGDSYPPSNHTAYLISDYATRDDMVPILLLEPFDNIRGSADPARHETLQLLDKIYVEFLDRVTDGDGEFLRFRDTGTLVHDSETLDRFDVLGDKFFAVDRYAYSLPHNLEPGIVLPAVVVVSTAGRRTISFRPWIRTALDEIGTAVRVGPCQVDRYHDAVIATLANQYDKVEVRLVTTVEVCGVAIGAQIDAKKVGGTTEISAEIGSRLQVSFRQARTNKWALKPLTPQLESMVKKSNGMLAVHSGGVIALKPLDLDFARDLASLEKGRNSELWREAVSALYDASQLIEVQDVRPALQQIELPASRPMLAFIRNERRAFEKLHQVAARVYDADAIITLTASEWSALNAARDDLLAFSGMKYIEAEIPQDTIGLVKGKEGRGLDELRGMVGVVRVWLSNRTVHVAAKSKHSIEAVLEVIEQKGGRATALVTVPREQASSYIGRGGANIRAALEATGVRSFRTSEDNVSRIEASRAADIQRFVAMCRSNAPGVQFRMVSINVVTVVFSQ